jgi:hypothetical protein
MDRTYLPVLLLLGFVAVNAVLIIGVVARWSSGVARRR